MLCEHITGCENGAGFAAVSSVKCPSDSTRVCLYMKTGECIAGAQRLADAKGRCCRIEAHIAWEWQSVQNLWVFFAWYNIYVGCQPYFYA